MKRLTHFESSIIGLFIGVVMASYVVYLESLSGFIGVVSKWVALIPVFNLFNFPNDQKLIFLFLFVVVVFILYGFIVGLLMRGGGKTKLFTIVLILLLIVGMFLERKSDTKTESKLSSVDIQTKSTDMQKPRSNHSQYFREDEIWGDLNSDGKDDVAFVIPREEKDRGMLYYFTAALAGDKGYSGTNLLFLGEGFEPTEISIQDSKIEVNYVARNSKKASSTKIMYAEIVDGVLKQVQPKVVAPTATTTE